MSLVRFLPVFFMALLAACATPPPVDVPDDLISAGALSRTGRFSVRVEPVGGAADAVQGGFAWYDAGTHLLLDLNSPLGAAMARVEVEPDGTAVLTEANGQRTVAPNADALVAKVLGSPIPVRELRYWLRGRMPAQPAARITERDNQGRPLAFTQAGWLVRISAYDASGPLRLQLHRAEPGVRTIEARLVINEAPSP